MEKHSFYMSSKEIKFLAKDNMSGSWGYSAKFTLLFYVLSLIILAGVIMLSVIYKVWYLIVPISIVGGILIYILWFGYQSFCLNMSSKLKSSFRDLFSGFGKKTYRIIVLLFMKLFVFAFGLCLAVIYGFVFDLSYSMSSFVLYSSTEKISSGDVLKQSKRLIKDNKTRLVSLRFSLIGWILLCFTIVGAIWALPYLVNAHAVFYLDLKADF